DEITRWIYISDWIHGETGCYLRHSTETRNWFETEYPQFLESASQPIDPAKRSNEHAIHILEALETNRVYRVRRQVGDDTIVLDVEMAAI
ncbi:alpha-glucosidase/alpha-galactosidase, partial [Rhizobium ruizarguesonis]